MKYAGIKGFIDLNWRMKLLNNRNLKYDIYGFHMDWMDINRGNIAWRGDKDYEYIRQYYRAAAGEPTDIAMRKPEVDESGKKNYHTRALVLQALKDLSCSDIHIPKNRVSSISNTKERFS